MKKEEFGSKNESLVIPELVEVRHYVRHGKLVLIDNRMSLGYSVRFDKRIAKEKVRDAKILLVTPQEWEIVELNEGKSKTHDSLETSQGYKSTEIFINSRKKVVKVEDYIFDMQRVNTSFGAKNLDLGISSQYSEIKSEILDFQGSSVNFLERHLGVLPVLERVVYQVE